MRLNILLTYLLNDLLIKLKKKIMDNKKKYKAQINYLMKNCDKNLPEIQREHGKLSSIQELILEGNDINFHETNFILLDGTDSSLFMLSKEELEKWENDGSLEKGDKLYSISFIKIF